MPHTEAMFSLDKHTFNNNFHCWILISNHTIWFISTHGLEKWSEQPLKWHYIFLRYETNSKSNAALMMVNPCKWSKHHVVPVYTYRLNFKWSNNYTHTHKYTDTRTLTQTPTHTHTHTYTQSQSVIESEIWLWNQNCHQLLK